MFRVSVQGKCSAVVFRVSVQGLEQRLGYGTTKRYRGCDSGIGVRVGVSVQGVKARCTGFRG